MPERPKVDVTAKMRAKPALCDWANAEGLGGTHFFCPLCNYEGQKNATDCCTFAIIKGTDGLLYVRCTNCEETYKLSEVMDSAARV